MHSHSLRKTPIKRTTISNRIEGQRSNQNESSQTETTNPESRRDLSERRQTGRTRTSDARKTQNQAGPNKGLRNRGTRRGPATFATSRNSEANQVAQKDARNRRGAGQSESTGDAQRSNDSNEEAVNPKSSFNTFGLDKSLLKGIEALGFTNPRPIQAKAIPEALNGRDVLGLAQTGTGKTAAFALPILQRLMGKKGSAPRALIVAPTRELAIQIHAEIVELGRFTGLKAATIFGGVSQVKQVRALKGRPDILIACPGRLLDLHKQRECDLSKIETLVLDEADHMFDMGFLPDIRRILTALPRERQNLLFSATMPKEIRSLADRTLNRPHVVELGHSKPASTIDHFLYPVGQKKKLDLLTHILKEDSFTSAIVFLRTKHRARRVARDLDRDGYRAIALQGNMSQGQRDRAMTGFREGRYDILVATDIAARGIDVANVSHVVNFDLPGTPDAYTHRIGRTGRSELSGKAVTFVTSEDKAGLRAIERNLGEEIPRRFIKGFAESGIVESGTSGSSSGDSKKRVSVGRGRSGGGGQRGGGRSRPSSTGASSGVTTNAAVATKASAPTWGAGVVEALDKPVRTKRAHRPKGSGPGRSRVRRGR
ncbi:MAG: ATP-dependent RNA helicase RhlE [Planctomycetota bacterium]